MNWAKNFTNTILQRGRNYWENGLVEDLEQVDQDTYTATVIGTYNYYVSVRRMAKGRLRLGCNCPYARDGNTCKHMAAVLFEIEENNPEFLEGDQDEQPKKAPAAAAATSPKVNPSPNIIKEVPSDLFRNYSSNQFFKLECVYDTYKISNEVYAKALNIIASGAARITYCGLTYQSYYLVDHNDPPRIEMACKIVADHTDYTVSLVLDRNYIFDLTCTQNDYYSQSSYSRRRSAYGFEDCSKSNISRKSLFYSHEPEASGKKVLLCKHKCAALILFDKYLREINPGDYTSYFGSALVNIIRQNEEDEMAKVPTPSTPTPQQKEPPVDFLLRISADSSVTSDLTLTASIGRTKYYKVRNISTLMGNIHNGEKVHFGKELSVDFSNTEFTERSKQFLDFISSLPTEYITGNSIQLEYGQLNMFYLKFQETGIDHETLGHLSFCDKDLRVKCSIEALEMEGRTEGLKVKIVSPTIFWSRKQLFTIDEKEKLFCRHTVESLGPLSEILKLSRKNSFTATIGRKEMKDFNYRILPILAKYGNVNTSKMPQLDEFSEILQPEFTFNLDYEKKMVLCKGLVNYGDNSYTLCDETPVDLETRDQIRENAVRKRLDSYFSQKSDVAWFTDNEDDIYRLLSEGLNQLMEIGTVNATDSFSALKLQKKSRIMANVSMEGSLLDLSIQSDDMDLQELMAVIDSYRKRKRYHRIKDGTFISLDNEDIAEFTSLIDALKLGKNDIIKGKISIPAYRSLYLNKIMEERDALTIERSSSFRKLIRDFASIKESDWEIPKTLNTKLRPYQEDGLRWLCTLAQYGFGGILADEMGLGKTVQLIALLLVLKERRKGTSLIVCPASLVYNWQSELQRFAPSLKVLVVTGKQSERETLISECNDFDAVVTSYDLLKRDIHHYKEHRFLVHVIDEAQYIKNHSTEASKSVKLIESDMRFALTGTPIENRLSELWSIFDFLMPGFLYGKEAFRSDFELPIMKSQDQNAVTRLKRMTGPFVLRRLKKDVLKDLPEKLEETRQTPMQKTQRKLYDAQVARIKDSLKKTKDADFSRSKIEILAEITKLRQVCCDPRLTYENYDGESAKRTLCMDLVETAIDGGHRMLIFSQFTSMLSLLESDLKERNIPYYEITGATDKRKRLQLVEDFNSSDIPVFLISLKAGGTGLNLTGADMVIHYDPWWNTAVQNQATDRVHRIGQTNVVTVYKLIASDSIEERIMELQNSKKDLADEIIGGETTSLGKMSKEDLLAILS